MIMIPPIAITDANFVSSNVPDTVEVLEVKATGTITCGNNDPVLNETFVIGPQTFTVVSTRTGTGQIQRDTNPNPFASHIETAVDLDVPDYVSTVRTDNVIAVTSVLDGAEGNDITFTTAVTGLTFSGSGTLEGGVDYVAGYAEWSDSITYDAGDVVVVTTEHHIYESLQGTNLNHSPPTNLTGETPYWLDLGATNRWKMFDGTVTSQTVNAESIVVAITPGAIDSVVLLNCCASSINIVLNDPVEGEVYNETILSSSNTSTNANYIKTDLPDDYPNATLTVTIDNTGGNASCGFLIPGLKEEIGTTLYAPEVTIIDYSIKEQDDWGNWSITERSYTRRNVYNVFVPIANHSEVKRLLAQYRATPVVWDGNGSSSSFSILLTYGIVKEWKMIVRNAVAQLSLEIEGLI
jgi:hypothetical protein